MDLARRPWAVPVASLLAELATSPGGLTSSEAAARRAVHGRNELPERRGPGALRQLAAQVTHLMALLLWAAGGLAFASGTSELGWAIWAVVAVNGGFSFLQERRAERALARLRQRLPAEARAWRDGRLSLVPVSALVPGDVLEVALGDRVPADARLLAADGLRLDLSLLTGEPLPVERVPVDAEPLCALAAEASSVVLAGAAVVGGRGRAVVFGTGSATALGEVARLTAGVRREPSTLSLEVARLVRVVTALAVGFGVAVLAASTWLVGLPIAEALLFSIGIVVANVPEGLLPTVTLALATGAQRMAHRRVLVRRLPALETLSAVSVVCTDKTGTLTENRMTVRAAWTPWSEAPLDRPGPEAVRRLLAAAALCTDAVLLAGPGEARAVARDPLEAAILAALPRVGLDPAALSAAAPRSREVPFDPARRQMEVVVRPTEGAPALLRSLGAGALALVKGAPAEVIARCDRVLLPGGDGPLDAASVEAIRLAADGFAARGERVVAVAARSAAEPPLADAPEGALSLLGLLAIADPPRPQARAALAACREAGVRVVMVTGDGPRTALAVAGETGLCDAGGRVVSGDELERMGDEALRALAASREVDVFARASPSQKLRLVRAFQALGEVVAVTGDGVNDAPALRAAHVGVAMGASGTDVAREAADVVLLDDDLGSLVAAVEEGRALFRNIRKFMAYILTSNVPEIVPFVAMVAARIPPGLTILQILAVDLGTDMAPALALGAEPPEPGLMRRPPRPRGAPLLDGRLLRRAYLRLGLVQAAASMGAYLATWRAAGVGLEGLRAAAPAILRHAADPAVAAIQARATTAALVAIVACQVANLFACRSERLSAFALPIRGHLLAAGLAVEGLLLAAVTLVPPLRRVFQTAPLAPAAWTFVLLGPLALLLVDEGLKVGARRRARRARASAG